MFSQLILLHEVSQQIKNKINKIWDQTNINKKKFNESQSTIIVQDLKKKSQSTKIQTQVKDKPVSGSLCLSCWKILLMVLPTILQQADEITNTIFFVKNWSDIQNFTLRNLLLFFTFFYSFSYGSFLIMADYKSIKVINQKTKIPILVLLFLIPVLNIVLQLFKVHLIIKKKIGEDKSYAILSSQKDNKKQGDNDQKLLSFFMYGDIFGKTILYSLFTTLPTIIIQLIINVQQDEFDSTAVISLLSSIFMLLYTIIQALVNYFVSSQEITGVDNQQVEDIKTWHVVSNYWLFWLLVFQVIGGIIFMSLAPQQINSLGLIILFTIIFSSGFLLFAVSIYIIGVGCIVSFIPIALIIDCIHFIVTLFTGKKKEHWATCAIVELFITAVTGEEQQNS